MSNISNGADEDDGDAGLTNRDFQTRLVSGGDEETERSQHQYNEETEALAADESDEHHQEEDDARQLASILSDTNNGALFTTISDSLTGQSMATAYTQQQNHYYTDQNEVDASASATSPNGAGRKRDYSSSIADTGSNELKKSRTNNIEPAAARSPLDAPPTIQPVLPTEQTINAPPSSFAGTQPPLLAGYWLPFSSPLAGTIGGHQMSTSTAASLSNPSQQQLLRSYINANQSLLAAAMAQQQLQMQSLQHPTLVSVSQPLLLAQQRQQQQQPATSIGYPTSASADGGSGSAMLPPGASSLSSLQASTFGATVPNTQNLFQGDTASTQDPHRAAAAAVNAVSALLSSAPTSASPGVVVFPYAFNPALSWQSAPPPGSVLGQIGPGPPSTTTFATTTAPVAEAASVAPVATGGNEPGDGAASKDKTTPLPVIGRLYLRCDDDHLSGYQVLLRKHLELFEAGPEDVKSQQQGRKKQIFIGQVGIRCSHCVVMPESRGRRGKGSVYFPKTLRGIYQAAQNMASAHLAESCCCVGVSLKKELVRLRGLKETAAGGKQYWADAGKALGVYETMDGLRYTPPKTAVVAARGTG